jgi:FtsH-binding integral membrane protein
MSYAFEHPLAIHAEQSERAAFIRRTYAHLAGAILAFIGLESVLLNLPNIDQIVGGMFGSRMSWFIVLFAFIGAGWLANAWAQSNTSPALQYLGLALYVVAEAIIFLPLLYIAKRFGGSDVIPTAAIMTLSMFGGLTLAVFVTRKDFSYLAPIIGIGSFLALGAVIAFAFIGGATFGLVIAFGIVALACVSILFQTSQIMLHYRTDQHVAASLGLFASVATLFYYILIILMNSRES